MKIFHFYGELIAENIYKYIFLSNNRSSSTFNFVDPDE